MHALFAVKVHLVKPDDALHPILLVLLLLLPAPVEPHEPLRGGHADFDGVHVAVLAVA